jgi:type IV secretory pathway protease TraF
MTVPAPDTLTHVEFIWFEKRIEQWIRFGHDVAEQILDRRRRILSFAPYVRWAANDFGTVVSRIDILRAVVPGEAFSIVPFVWPGGVDFSPPFRLAQGRARAPGHRRRRAAQCRSSGCLSRSLPATPQPARVLRTAARLHGGAASGLASAPEDRSMTRSGRIATTCIAALGLGLSALFRPAPRQIWNASASVPIGLYAVQPTSAACQRAAGCHAAGAARDVLDERRYLPEGVPLLKHVLALPGQAVCRSDRTIIVDGVVVADALDRDQLSRPLPVWHGCRRCRRRCLPHEPAVRGFP